MLHLYIYVYKIKGSLQESEDSKGVGPRSGQSHGPAVAAQLSQPSCHGVLPGGGGLHVVEPELLLHVTIGHLAKGLLVVLHELEDGSQLFLLNSVKKKG